ncbi:MAG: DUF1893 domain-containing protein [Sphaerochaetaceae bacterium]|jgi:hypothetical protein|nr:DUF1893 domain-containing protein [Sphaerochaetaceae bacterium]NLY08122.1 DUF1893 domain-containing protein [Spirochaetales bacterium]
MKDPENSLEAWIDDEAVFSSKGHWLMPLLELEKYLCEHRSIKPSDIELHDTKGGRAAAGLAIGMGIRSVVLDLVSDYALEMYSDYGVKVSFAQRVPQIACATEKLITFSMTPSEIHALVLGRIAGQ